MANGRIIKLNKQAARAVESERMRILDVDVFAVVRSGLESIHLAVSMDGGSMLMSVAMNVWKIESAMRLGLPERGTIAMCRKARNTASALKMPFNTIAVNVCFMRNVACLRDMRKNLRMVAHSGGYAVKIVTKRNIRFGI
jgi:hypothetical protein